MALSVSEGFVSASPKYYLAIDQGGHASRALVFGHRGDLICSAYRDIATQQPHALMVEHNAEELVASIKDAILDAVQQLGSGAQYLVAAGLATQRSSLVFWNKNNGEALTPVISWQDRRAHALIDQWGPYREDIRTRTGLFMNPHYGASKIRWLMDEREVLRQALAQQTLAVGPLASFLLFRLLREKPLFADPANGSRTMLLNVKSGQWDSTLLERFGIAEQSLPKAVPSRYSFGHLTVSPDLPLTICTGDQSAAFFVHGVPNTDTLMINTGTGAFVSRVLDEANKASPRLLQSIVYSDSSQVLRVLEGTVNGAGRALDWYAAEAGITNWTTQFDQWLLSCEEIPVFINGVSGVGSPFWLSSLNSTFIGSGSVEAKLVAVTESILFLLNANLDVMNQPAKAQRIVLSGGLSVSDPFCQRLADLTGQPVHRTDDKEATGRGLVYLLASMPANWPQAQAKIFNPLKNKGVAGRYAIWKQAMQTLSQQAT